jgi:hypothetical protein
MRSELTGYSQPENAWFPEMVDRKLTNLDRKLTIKFQREKLLEREREIG